MSNELERLLAEAGLQLITPTPDEAHELGRAVEKAIGPAPEIDGPIPIPLPPEPPRDRAIEAVDADGKVMERCKWNGTAWDDQRAPSWRYDWGELVGVAIHEGWSLRHVAAEGGETT